MKISRTKKASPVSRRKPQFTRAKAKQAKAVAPKVKPKPKPKRVAKPKRTVAQKPKRTVAASRKRRTTHDALPGWGDLDATRSGRVAEVPPASALLDAVPTTRFVLLLIAVAAAFTLYVGHVHASQDLLADVQELRRDNLSLHLRYNRIKGEYDRATGPAVIHRRARSLGLVEDAAYGPTIRLNP